MGGFISELGEGADKEDKEAEDDEEDDDSESESEVNSVLLWPWSTQHPYPC
jgi:hypothetical protein